MSTDDIQSFSMVKGLMQPEAHHPQVAECVLIETHISWVIIAEPYAYKIKKALDMGFLDFSTLEKRHHFCQEEVRLNKKLAPNIYLGVIPITGTVASPQWDGDGEPIEYAVKMRAFPQEKQLDRVLADGLLRAEQFDLLARHIANFHEQTEEAAKESDYGSPEVILHPVLENFVQIREHCTNKELLELLAQLEKWNDDLFESLRPFFTARKNEGFVKECHGDMHLRNIAWVDDQPVVFDCIEFNPYLRWIDVINDVAFLVMDLDDRKQPEFASRFINKYFEYTGDYESIHIFKYYLVYRALVRAKIDAIRADQAGISSIDKNNAEKSFQNYLQLALDYTRVVKPQLIITRGMSASGKSTVSQELMEKMGAIRIRTDVERKRLFGLQPEHDSSVEIDEGIYNRNATEKTYSRLVELAEKIIGAGCSVIVDGVFLHRWQRQLFRDLAENKNVPFIIMECVADIATLRNRIKERKKEETVSDADLKVLENQHAIWQPLDNDELSCLVTVDTEKQVEMKSLICQFREIQ